MSKIHPLAAADHLPGFITAPGSTDVLFVIVMLVVIAAVLAIGVLFFWLHSLPERMVHNSTKIQVDLVAILALLSLFTHIHAFWVAALLIAIVPFPDFSVPSFSEPLARIAAALERLTEDRHVRALKGQASEPNGARVASSLEPVQSSPTGDPQPVAARGAGHA